MKQKYCLQSVAGFHAINQSMTNRSKTKQTFSFCKSPRFAATIVNCPRNTYDGRPISRKNSGASIGSGKKYDFTKNTADSPGSSKYLIKNHFDQNEDKGKGYSIGVDRSSLAFNSYINSERLMLPGVGRYHLQTQASAVRDRAPAYSMRKRTKMIDKTQTLQAQNSNPSPAHYENNPQKSNSLFSTHFKKISFSGSKSKRFFNPDNRLPGPGCYENPTNLSKVGRYVVSSQQGGTNAKFDKSKRVTQFQDVERVGRTKPGPGSYRQSSQFGQYDGNVYNYQVGNSKRLRPYK